MNEFDSLALVGRYIAVWNESDADARAAGVRELWAADGALVNNRQEYRGHDALIEAVTRSFDRFIARGYRYRARDAIRHHHDGIHVPWELVGSDGELVSFGPNFLLLGQDRRIRLDFQFVER